MTHGQEDSGSRKEVFIHLPKDLKDCLSQKYELTHGLFVTGLSPDMNERFIKSYFKEWGTVTSCKIRNQAAGGLLAVAFVSFSSEDEADKAYSAGPHCVGGLDVEVKQVVSPKFDSTKSEDETESIIKTSEPDSSKKLDYIKDVSVTATS